MPTNRKPIGRGQRAPGRVPCGLWSLLTDQPYDPLADDEGGRLTTFVVDHGTLWNAHRAVVLAWWVREHPLTRPRLWWKFEAPGELRRGETQAEFLRRHRLLLPGEL